MTIGYRILTSFTPPYAGSLARLVEAARADLAARLGFGVASVTVASVHAVVWSDSSIGCPLPGRAYAQALVEGALIELRAGDVAYRYHSAEGRPAFLCERR